uniref:class II aldolase/adducin family protein n=1 Tax=Undibacterium sp. TaxID=1914977 RepID=UPI00375313F4
MSTQHQDPRDQVIAYCAKLGTDPLLVQGAGGNVSWKAGNSLWVKASGTWLAQAHEKDIFVAVDLPHLKAAIANGDMAVTPRPASDSALRPSIETLLHALMPQTVVVHLHAIEILAHLVKADVSKQLATKLTTKLAGKISYGLTPYRKPGAPLAQAVMAALQQQANTQVVFLQNHGVVIGADTVEEVDRLLQILLNAMRTEPLASISMDQAGIETLVCSDQIYHRV